MMSVKPDNNDRVDCQFTHDEPIRLARIDWERFLAALEETDPTPSPRLSAAMERFAYGTFSHDRYEG